MEAQDSQSSGTASGIDLAAQTTTEPQVVRWLLIGTTASVLGVSLILPLVTVFVEAFRDGWQAYLSSFRDRSAQSAIRLTLLTALIAVPVNLVFGLAASWLIGKFTFPGRNLLLTLIDLPLSMSPVVSGLVFVLVFGAHGWLGPWLADHGIRVIFAVPGIILVTMFVTLPYVAREVIPLMQQQGDEEEQAALSLGASGLSTFWFVTLPNVRWAVLYGVILANARAMGEFGAVSVVSGHIRGKTNTLPLHVEVLYNEYHTVGAFAAASLLTFLALVTLLLKTIVEWRLQRQYQRVSSTSDADLIDSAGNEPPARTSHSIDVRPTYAITPTAVESQS